MKREDNVQIFLSLVQAGLWSKASDATIYERDVDWSDICRLAEEQSVVGLIVSGLEISHGIQMVQDVLLTLVGTVMQIEKRNEAMNVFLALLMKLLHDAEVEALLVKGQGVAQCYDKPLWRTCGDIDLFLTEENYEKAKRLLLPLASGAESEQVSKKHVGLTIDGWTVELHGKLKVGLSKKIDAVLQNIQDETFSKNATDTWKNSGSKILMPRIDNHVFYVFVHFLNHFYKGGVGLRQICDWCRMLWYYREELDYEKIEVKIKKSGLLSEWRAFAAFAVEYLGMPQEAMPFYEETECLKRKARRILDFIIMSGNFGHNRDMSYYAKYPYLVRKSLSLIRRVDDMINHARIFPVDSFRFFPYVVQKGIRSAVKGEG